MAITKFISSPNVDKLEHIRQVLAFRFLTLLADFSMLTTSSLDTIQCSLSDLPIFESGVSPYLFSQLLDYGRSNSVIHQLRKTVSYFGATYHRDGAGTNPLLESNLILDDSPYARIPVVDFLVPYISSILALKPEVYKDPQFEPYVFEFNKFNLSVERTVLHAPKENKEKLLKLLGYLGALPNRDWQIKYYSATFPQHVTNKRLVELLIQHTKSDCVLPDILSVHLNPNSILEHQDKIITKIREYQTLWFEDDDQEQRFFYSDFLVQLILFFSLKSPGFNFQNRMQISAALNRIELMVSVAFNASYEVFLRTFEAILDEIIILLIVINEEHPLSTRNITDNIKQFLFECTQRKPDFATYRSSCMQAFWSAFTLCHHYCSQANHGSIKIFISNNIYIEMYDGLIRYFNLPRSERKKDFSFRAKEGKSSIRIYNHADQIYDVYIASFESNIDPEFPALEFVDVDAFIETQIECRKRKEVTRPLWVIIDNTMSDFDDVYLSSLLHGYSDELSSGLLCVFVIHSGNKYLHLGSDKELAALFYAFFNPAHFPTIKQAFEDEIEKNQIGDFEVNSPTLLLTNAYLTAGKNHLLKYSPLIRYRTESIFRKAVPMSLVTGDHFIQVDSPVSTIKKGELAPSLKNYCGFITFRFFTHEHIPDEYRTKVFELMLNFIETLGIFFRDGFGFSETCFSIFILTGIKTAIRIAIGTELLESLCNKINATCRLALEFNRIILDFILDKKNQINAISLEEFSSKISATYDQHLKEDAPSLRSPSSCL